MKERSRPEGTDEQARLKRGWVFLFWSREKARETRWLDLSSIQWLSAVEQMFAGLM